jgi:hypothetical protein
MARQVGHKQHLKNTDDERDCHERKNVHLRKYFYSLVNISNINPANTANRNAVSKSNSRKLKPTNIAIPNNATVVPIQKLVAGFVLRNT